MLNFDPESHIYTIDGKIVPSVTGVVARVRNGFAVSDAVINQAARRGSIIHEYCELIDYGAPPELVEPQLVGYVNAYQAFLRDYMPKWEYIEKPLGDAELGFAGTLDRLGVIGKRKAIVDIKTTSSMDREAKIQLACQLAGYGILANSNGLGVDFDYLGVNLKANGKYTVINRRDIEKRYGFDASCLFATLLLVEKIVGGKE